MIRTAVKKHLPHLLLPYVRVALRQARGVRLQLRMLNPRPRLAPSFLIIGAMKAGTTSLFRYLLAHPQVATPLTKEIHYFSFNSARPRDWYLAHFPRTRAFTPDRISGEASPAYLVHPDGPERVHAFSPAMRIIVLLRDPVARSLSHYFHEKTMGRELRPVDEALFAEEASTSFSLRPREERPWYEALNGTPGRRRRSAALLARCPMHLAYLTHSCYADHLPAWLRKFDRDQILLLRSEDLFLGPARELTKTIRFLGLDAWTPGPLTPQNVGTYPATVSPDTVSRLRAAFAEPNRRLRELVGNNMAWDSE